MKRLNRTIAVAMLAVACAVPCATAAPVWAEEEPQGTEAQEAEVDVAEDESDGTDDNSAPVPGAEYDAATGKYANSFRFKDGAPVTNGGDEDGISLLSSRADSLITWSYKDGAYRFSNGIVDSRATAIGIDVSEWQDDINWSKVKNAGVDYAILRCGYGLDDPDQDDSKFIDNVRGCQKYGIPFGVYLYSYGENTTHAKSEAKHVLRLLKEAGLTPDDLAFPVYYDLEDEPSRPSNATLLKMAKIFCEAIEDAGYEPGIYASLNWWNTYLTDPAYDQWDRWVAQYYTECDYKGDYSMWQCMSNGKVAGISGPVDMNLSYGDGKLVVTDAGIRYQYPSGEFAADEMLEHKGRFYYFGSDGYALTGEQEIDGRLYLFGDDGAAAVGWHEWADGTRSYFSSDYKGAASKGWWKLSGKYYYFDPETFRTLTGEQEIAGRLYLFGDDGAATVGWHEWADGTRSYFSSDYKGAASKGWWKLSGKYYYFDPETFRTLTGEQEIAGRLYLFGDDGAAAVGWHEWADGTRSYFSSDYKGAASKGWWKLSGKYYYFDPETFRTLTGEQEIAGRLYLFGDDGAATVGWHEWADGTRSYFSSDYKGAASKGWWKLSGSRYYFDTETFRAYTGVHIIGTIEYTFSDTGVLISSREL